ncbi:unnamed protein product [Rotaria socialis]|uniref:Poly [ADP-ribose] polymerase n=2 Tax=Rotaria socialis TaxID=392032 RepID=A0A820ZQ00_9BILA|nr:unnamed protein product [Rotaria socialis]
MPHEGRYRFFQCMVQINHGSDKYAVVYNESIGPNPADRKSTEIIKLTDAQQNFLQFFGERILKRIREESGIERVNILTGKLELYGRAQSTRTMKTYLESSLNQQTADITAALAKYLNLKFKGPLTNACLNKYRVGISYREIVKNAEIVIAKPICERDEDENESDHDDKGLPSNVKRGGNHVQVTLCSDSSELLSEAINEFRNYLLITDSFLLTQDEVSFILKTQNFRTNRDRQNHIRNYFNDFVQSRKNCHVYVLIFPKKGSWCVQVKGFREHVDTIVLEMKNFLSKHVQTEQQIVISTPMTIYLRKKGSSDLNTVGETLGIRIQPFSLDRFKSDEQDDKNSYLKLTGSISRVNDARNAVVTFLENLCEQERQYPCCPSWYIATKIERKVRAHLRNLLDSKDCSAVGWLKNYSRTVRLETQPENTLTVVGFNEDATSNVFQQCENLIGEFLVWTPSDGEFDMIFQRLIVRKSPSLKEFENEWDANIQLKRDPNSIIIWARSKMLVAEIQTAMLTLANKQPVRQKRRSEFIRIPKNIRRFIDEDTKSLIDEARAQEVFLESRGGEVLIFRGPLDHVIKLKEKIDNIIKRVQEQVVERRLRFALVESYFLRANNYKVALRMEEETNTVIRYINVDSNDEKTNFVKIIFQNIRGQTIIVEIGDITKVEHVDAIVNGANGSLKHAGGVAKAIAKAAGPALDQECKELISNNGDLPIPVGRAVKTTAGNLPFKCVIHAISPHYSDGYQNKHPLLFASVLSALEVAESESCSSVALPAIGSKINGFPLVVCANVVVRAMKQFFANYPRSKLRNIVLIDVDKAVSTAFEYEIRVDHRTPHLNNDDDDMMNCQAAPSTVKWCWQDKSGERMYNEDDTRQIENAFLRFRNSEIPNVPNNVPHSTIWNIFGKKDACDTCHAECFIENVKLRCDNLMSATLIGYELHFNRDKKKIVIEDPAALKNSFVVGYQLRKDTGKKCDIIRHPVQQQERTAPVVMSQNPLDLFYCVSEIGGGEWNLFGLCHQSVQEAEDKIRLAIEEVKVSETVSVKLDTNLDQHKSKIAEIGYQQRIQIEFEPESTEQLSMILKGLRGGVAEAKFKIFDYAQNILRMQIGNDEDLRLPSEWIDQQEECRLVEIDRNDPNFMRIETRMKETMPNIEVHKMERVQNPRMWNHYAFCHRNLRNELRSMPDLQVEMELFHGTKNAPPSEIYLGEYEFDMTFCESGMWGIGTYFAQNASYSCDLYAHLLSNGKRQVFLAQVLTGHVYDCQYDRTLRRPPKKNENIDGRRYNSVSGDTKGSKVYIVYENRVAYPTYLITFS